MPLRTLPTRLYSHRIPILLLLHTAVFIAAYWLATALRFDFAIPPESWELFRTTVLWYAGCKLICAYTFGSFHGWMRYVTFHDLVVLLRASIAGSLLVVVCDYALFPTFHTPRSILIFDFLLTVLAIGGLRSAGRLSREQLFPFLQGRFLRERGFRPALLIGATPKGTQLAAQIHNLPELKTRIVGLLDADESLHGRRLSGILVLGSPLEVKAHAAAWNAKDVYLLAGTLRGKSLRDVIDRCREAELNLKVLPSLDEVVGGQSIFGPQGLRLRDVDIDDLLRRETVRLDEAAVAAFVRGKVVAVTGAGGSIGSEICRQLLRFGPRAIVLVERAENNLFNIDRELRSASDDTAVVPCIADVCDTARMRQVFDSHRPQVLFHAAAHKHVPMMEYNPGEAFKNNTFGTKVVADLAHEFGLESFVLVSTDKAVNPSSVMGLSKQLAERYVYALSQQSQTRFIAVRFGNVLGSVGSVVPIFQEQIRSGGPITVTHPEMTRYFMTIPEASQLVMQAGAMGRGGEIFVLDMGEPVKIVDLARDLIRLSGLSPDDIDIAFTGIRPGEKLYEELYFSDEQTLSTPHPKLRVAYHRPYHLHEVARLFDALHAAVESAPADLFKKLKKLVPEFSADDSSDAVAGAFRGASPDESVASLADDTIAQASADASGSHTVYAAAVSVPAVSSHSGAH